MASKGWLRTWMPKATKQKHLAKNGGVVVVVVVVVVVAAAVYASDFGFAAWHFVLRQDGSQPQFFGGRAMRTTNATAASLLFFPP